MSKILNNFLDIKNIYSDSPNSPSNSDNNILGLIFFLFLLVIFFCCLYSCCNRKNSNDKQLSTNKKSPLVRSLNEDLLPIEKRININSNTTIIYDVDSSTSSSDNSSSGFQNDVHYDMGNSNSE